MLLRHNFKNFLNEILLLLESARSCSEASIHGLGICRKFFKIPGGCREAVYKLFQRNLDGLEFLGCGREGIYTIVH